MDRQDETELEAALARLAEAETRLAPRPGPDLMARVLADAARVSAERQPPQRAQRSQSRAQRRGARWSLSALRAELWLAGATVALAACLTAGFYMGYSVEPPQPLVAANDDGMMVSDASGVFGPDAPF